MGVGRGNRSPWQTPVNRVGLGTASVLRLVQGWESRYYLGKEIVPLLEVEIHEPGKLVTRCLVQADGGL